MQVERRNAKVSRIAQMEALAPPVDPVEALRRNFLEALFPGGDVSEVAEGMRLQKEKMKAGDTKATDFVVKTGLALVKGGERVKPGPAPVHDLYQWRVNLAHIISGTGPQRDVELLEKSGGRLLYMDVLAVLNHEWFEREGGKWYITAAARKECPGLSR
jgi:hypothetical protein